MGRGGTDPEICMGFLGFPGYSGADSPVCAELSIHVIDAEDGTNGFVSDRSAAGIDLIRFPGIGKAERFDRTEPAYGKLEEDALILHRLM